MEEERRREKSGGGEEKRIETKGRRLIIESVRLLSWTTNSIRRKEKK